jgi:shikimate dehydrogenase
MSAFEQARAMQIHGGTRTLGVIGWPVEHSLSPAIHNAAFRSLGMPWVYIPMPVAPGTLAEALTGLVALGFEGANVTMPHKTEAADLADDLTDDARLLRAANTLTVQNGAILGDNTDAPGFERFLVSDVGFVGAGASALLLGAGGAARAVALALARSGVAELTVAAREPATAMAIVELLDGSDVEVRAVPLDEAAGHEAHLIVNATPVGADGVGTLPSPAMGPGVVVVDLLYRSMTPLRASAERAGATSFSGLGLLVHQAALSFERWTEQPAPLAVMAEAAEMASAEGP